MVAPEVKWWDSAFILKAEVTEFADKLDVVSERSKNDSKVFN